MKLFVTDLDKTFLKSDLSVGSFSKKVWQKFPYPLTIATARSYTGAKNLLKDIPLRFPLILLDGALITTPKGEILYYQTLEKRKVDHIIATIEKEFDERPLLVGHDGLKERFCYPKRLNIYQKELLQNYKNDNRLLNLKKVKGLKINFKIVYLGSKELLEAVEKRVKELIEAETKLSKDPYQNCYFLTILHPKGDKAHALKWLQEIYNFTHTTAFGDSLNDLGMFANAQKAIAVKNALEEVKRAAHQVLPHTNDEEAVAHYLAVICKKSSF